MTALYVVKKGDYLKKIAAEQLGNAVRWAEIAELNSLDHPYTIFPEQVLQLPPKNSETVVIDIVAPPVPKRPASAPATKQAGFALTPATIAAVFIVGALFLMARK